MRLLTYEQQATVPADKPIGTLEQQGLPPDTNGASYVVGTLDAFIERGSVGDWRHAIALGLVRRSRYGTWEPFRTKKGGERTIACNEGIAHASDGVHILILGFDGRWFSRSSQVVEFHIDPAYEPGYASANPERAKRIRVRAATYLKTGIKQPKAEQLLAEYASL